jgi:hypothetical protein
VENSRVFSIRSLLPAPQTAQAHACCEDAMTDARKNAKAIDDDLLLNIEGRPKENRLTRKVSAKFRLQKTRTIAWHEIEARLDLT